MGGKEKLPEEVQASGLLNHLGNASGLWQWNRWLVRYIGRKSYAYALPHTQYKNQCKRDQEQYFIN